MTMPLLSLATLLVVAGLVNAETITVRSGNGAIGARDSLITFLLGPPAGDFDHTLTSSDSSSAQDGPPAYIIPPNPLWITGLSEDSSAQWIGTNPASEQSGNTALYAVSFDFRRLQLSQPDRALRG